MSKHIFYRVITPVGANLEAATFEDAIERMREYGQTVKGASQENIDFWEAQRALCTIAKVTEIVEMLESEGLLNECR